MNHSVYRISLDIQGGRSCQLDAKQWDTHRRVQIDLTDGGIPYALSAPCFPVLMAKTPDNVLFNAMCSVEDNTVLCDIPSDLTKTAGLVRCELRLYNAAYPPGTAAVELLTSATFVIRVLPAVYTIGDEAALAGSDEGTALTQLITKATEAIADLKEAKISGAFNGFSVTHEWEGTTLHVTSASGTSSADLKGEKGDPGIVNIDDSTVGPDTWSSKNILDRLCPAICERGTVVQCVPVAGYPLAVVTKFAAVQEGSGDPAPDHVRPIIAPSILGMGWWTGKNLYRYDRENVEAGYVGTSGGEYDSQNYYRTQAIPVSHLRGKTITLNPRPGGSAPAVAFYDDMGEGISGAGGKGIALKVPNNAGFMRFSINKEVVADEVDGETVLKENTDVQIQLELGSTATDYEPFKEQNLFTIELPEGAACGIYDWNTGLLTVTHKAVTLGELDWFFSGANSSFVTTLNNCKNTGNFFADDLLCNAYVPATDGSYADQTICIELGENITDGAVNIVDVAFTEDEVETFVDHLNELGAVLVYPLEEPYTVQYDPRQVLALDGVNYLAGGSGNTKVSGRADPAALINSLLSRVADLEAAAVNNI